MAATVTIQRLTSTGPTETDITGINTRAQTDDTHSTAGTTNPIPIPASSTNYSFWVNTRLKAAGTFSTIGNVKWYTDGAGFAIGGTSTGLSAKGNNVSTDAQTAGNHYVQATGTTGTSGTQLTVGNYSANLTTPVDIFTFTSGSPKAVSSTTYSATGYVSDIFVYQIEVASTTPNPGTMTAETFTWRYDET